VNKFQDILKGGDLRSIGKANEIVGMVNDQTAFDELFKGMTCSDRKVVMRTADAIEKITLKKPDYLQKHKTGLLNLCQRAKDIELKWHLALLVSRLSLTEKETAEIWQLLTTWATDKKASRIVRVNSLQGLYTILQTHQKLEQDFKRTVNEISKEQIPSINARIRKFEKSTLKENNEPLIE